jgi:predicted Zn-dependent peptidase
VTASDLRRVARRYLVDSTRTIVRVRPEDNAASPAGNRANA